MRRRDAKLDAENSRACTVERDRTYENTLTCLLFSLAVLLSSAPGRGGVMSVILRRVPSLSNAGQSCAPLIRLFMRTITVTKDLM